MAWKRGLLSLWVLLSVLGALNQSIAERLLGRRFHLPLPSLSSGYIMFVRVPRTIEIHEYIGTDGQRRSVADLIDTPGLFYERARVEANLTLYPDLLEQICLRRLQKQREMPMLVVSTWRLGLDRDRPEKEMSLRCTQRGLLRAPAPQAGGR